MMNLNFQNKYTNSVNFGRHWKVVYKKGLHDTRTHMITKRDKKEL